MPSEDGADKMAADECSRSISFVINGQKYVVTSSVSPHMRLVDYIRDHVSSKGTKVLCREGGCGACTVVATVPSTEGGTRSFSVQACQQLVYACSGWAIETIENLGNRYEGYHLLQKSLVGFYGTQCGFCSPGMIMTMYGELKRTGTLSSQQVERALDGNICRCTGYRPILDAFKALTVDADPKLKQRLVDIEEAYKNTCPTSGKQCSSRCKTDDCTKLEMMVSHSTADIHVNAGAVQWYQPATLKAAYSIMKRSANERMLLVAGNTAAGVFKHDGPYSTYMSLDRIPQLQQVSLDSFPLVIGARVSLTRCIEAFEEVSATGPTGVTGYRHMVEVADHWRLVANLAVRNNGSWAGNLCLKTYHPEFPSDIFITLAACDVTLNLGDASTGQVSRLNVTELNAANLRGKLILSMEVPPFPAGTYLRTFKISARAANSHAYVNSALKMAVDPLDNFKVTAKPGLYFGGLGPHFVSASQTEDYLTNKLLNDHAVVQEAIKRLAAEVVPEPDPIQGSVEYRKALVLALFYKTIIWLMKNQVSPHLKSAGDKLQRSLNTGQQAFEPNKDTWPVGEAIPKLESEIQVSGEAEYADDMVPGFGELHGAFVQSKNANARIDAVDPSDALAVAGVVSFVSAEDIVGTNSFVPKSLALDKVFASSRVQYAGQSVGLIVANSRETALQAAGLVKVKYSDIKKPVTSIDQAIKRDQEKRDSDQHVQTAAKKTDEVEHCEKALEASPHSISGEFGIGTQFHFPIEALSARVTPMEDGYDVVCTTQDASECQSVVAQVLDIPANSINMETRRIGGGFGGKISRGHIVACAAAVAASKTMKPVKVTLDLRTYMTLVGWREPYHSSYEVGFDDTGKLLDVKVTVINDCGHVSNDSSVFLADKVLRKTLYNSSDWAISTRTVNTDTAANTWCRTPGTVECVAIMENMIEHVASYLGKDPLQVREVNLAPDQEPGEGGRKGFINGFKNSILPLLKQKSMVEERRQEVLEFNKSNRWRKRGLSVMPLLYSFSYPPSFRYAVQVTIYQHDGTVAISHGGIEMGQGINTKAAQVAAKVLGVPLSLIKVKPNSSVASANSSVTGGSFGSDLVCHGVKICCEKLYARIDAVRKVLMPVPAWPQLIQTCVNMDVDISERYWTANKEHPAGYPIWGGACMEVEVDVLTGQYLMRRADIVQDVGKSISPYVDVGQVEGAFVMGLGLFTTEELRYNEDTGEKMVTGTWEYKPPTALDIPEDLRITFLPNAPNPHGVLSSKATGEPPLVLSFSVVTALRDAIAAARADSGVTGWFRMDTPVTVERVHQLCYVKPIPVDFDVPSIGGPFCTQS